MDQHNEDTQANRLIKFGMRLGVSAALHPFEYAKVLIQVHELRYIDSLHGLDKTKQQKNTLFAYFRLVMNPLHRSLAKHFLVNRHFCCQTFSNMVEKQSKI